jgi:hypothetical protein
MHIECMHACCKDCCPLPSIASLGFLGCKLLLKIQQGSYVTSPSNSQLHLKISAVSDTASCMTIVSLCTPTYFWEDIALLLPVLNFRVNIGRSSCTLFCSTLLFPGVAFARAFLFRGEVLFSRVEDLFACCYSLWRSSELYLFLTWSCCVSCARFTSRKLTFYNWIPFQKYRRNSHFYLHPLIITKTTVFFFKKLCFMILTVTRQNWNCYCELANVKTYMYTCVLYDVHKAWGWPALKTETCRSVE